MTRKEEIAVERRLPPYLRARRWFRAKARTITRVRIEDSVPLGEEASAPRVVLANVELSTGPGETYVLFLPGASKAPRKGIREIAGDARFCRTLLAALASDARLEGTKGDLAFFADGGFRRAHAREKASLRPRVSKSEQSNTSIVFGKRFILKLYRRVESGIHPDVEVGSFLTAKGFEHSPRVAGRLEYQPREGAPTVLGLLQGFIPNKGDGWEQALAAVRKSVTAGRSKKPTARQNVLGAYAHHASLLGRRTADMHLALGSSERDGSFAPEPFTPATQRSLYDELVRSARRALDLLASRIRKLPAVAREKARRVVGLRGAIEGRFGALLARRLESSRIRCHGDYHLGQVLFTGSDFVITDFEGEVARPLAERRSKSSPLRDVAGMMRSFHYAAHAALLGRWVGRSDVARLEARAREWYTAASVAFFDAYARTFVEKGALVGGSTAPSFPRSAGEGKLLLHVHLLEKAIYEIEYELNNRPDWLRIPLDGLLAILES
jgi:trehalose synthase-fused probable maltokinase